MFLVGVFRMAHSKIDVNEVARLRKLGYTQKQIGKRMGVTQQRISLVLLERRDRTKEESEIGVRI